MRYKLPWDLALFIFPARGGSVWPSPARIVRMDPQTQAETLIEVALVPDGGPGPRAEDFAPGRFVQVTIPGVGECPISLSSEIRPDGRFDLCVRRAGLVRRRSSAWK